jgi:hypothetical protein
MKTILKRYRLLYQISEAHGRASLHPAYLETVYGYPDIYAKEHLKLVAHTSIKSQKFNKKVVQINVNKHMWV